MCNGVADCLFSGGLIFVVCSWFDVVRFVCIVFVWVLVVVVSMGFGLFIAAW